MKRDFFFQSRNADTLVREGTGRCLYVVSKGGPNLLNKTDRHPHTFTANQEGAQTASHLCSAAKFGHSSPGPIATQAVPVHPGLFQFGGPQLLSLSL